MWNAHGEFCAVFSSGALHTAYHEERMNDRSWRKDLAARTRSACRGCALCDGRACAGEVPGIGGKGRGDTFVNNVLSWEEISAPWMEASRAARFSMQAKTRETSAPFREAPLSAQARLPEIAVAPITGVDENIGGAMPEAEFHDALVRGAKEAGIFSCIGDGVPDYKFTDGVAALVRHSRKAAIIIKPHRNRIIIERFELAAPYAEAVGIDIDACTLATVESKAAMEKKDARLLLEIQKFAKIPFVIKGICREEELELLDAVRPDIVVISNHGGRVADELEGIAYTLERLAPRARNFCGEVWVDGGLRTREHLLKAAALGAKRVLIARPFIQGVVCFGADGVRRVLQEEFA